MEAGSKPGSPVLVASRDGVTVLAAALAGQDRAGLDTEFVSERTYRPVLCLISLAWSGGEALVDAMAFPDLRPLAPALCRPGFTLVLHAGSQDLPLLERRLGGVPERVFDTQVAAAFLGHGQVSYQRLVQAVLGIRLEGASGFSDWTRRPLSPEQLRYAQEDARHLPGLATALEAELERRGRLDWFWEECRLLRQRSLEQAAPEAWERVDGARRLRPRQLAVLRELAAWREEEASRVDVPVGYVARDATLVALALQLPRDQEALGRVRGMAGGQLRRYGPEILAAVERGLACPREQWPRLPEPPREEPGIRLASDFLAAWVRKRAEAEGLTGPLLATRADVADLVRWHRGGSGRGPAPRVMEGWRRALVGEELVDLLAGRRALALQDGDLRLVKPG